MRSSLRLATAVALVATAPAAVRAQDIDTRNVDSYVWGGGGIYGQTFTVGSLTSLLSFSFWVGGNDLITPGGGTGPYDFYAQLFAWNGTSIFGSALYTSGVFNSGCCDDNVPPRFDFNTGGIGLTSGAQYLALVARTDPGGLKVGYVRGPNGFIDSYPGGEFVGGFNSGGNPDPATAAYFPIQFIAGNDLMFVADFDNAQVVPEPATFVLVLSGLGLVGLVRRRVRR
jgi:hypothetical protein